MLRFIRENMENINTLILASFEEELRVKASFHTPHTGLANHRRFDVPLAYGSAYGHIQDSSLCVPGDHVFRRQVRCVELKKRGIRTRTKSHYGSSEYS